MSKHKVVHFEIPLSDLKTKEFYVKVFGWKTPDWGEEYVGAITTEADKDGKPTEAGGINGGFYRRKSKKDVPSFVVDTDSIDETLKTVKINGGTITREKEAIGEMGFMAEFKDPDGNEISLWQQAKL